MTLTVAVVPGIVPRVVLSGGVVGQRVEGVGVDGSRWLVTESFPSHAIVDPQAPLNTPFHYIGDGGSTATVLRESHVDNAFTSLDGNVKIPFIMPHSWEEKLDTGLSTVNAAGNIWTMYGKAPTRGTHPVSARVEGAYVQAMRSLIEAQRAFVFLHNVCPVPHCPVPPVLVAETASYSASVTNRKDCGELVFSLDLQRVNLDVVVPARTWWDTLVENETWFGVDIIAEAFK